MANWDDIGALWEKVSKKGQKFLSGNITIDGVKHEIILFTNSNKEKPNHPDWHIYPSTPREEQPQENAQPQKQEESDVIDYPDEEIDPDDIPF